MPRVAEKPQPSSPQSKAQAKPQVKPQVKEAERIAAALLPLAVPIKTLKLDPNNARLHGDRSIEVIQDSLRAYGQKKPIVVRRETMTVVAGNGTLEAAIKMGWTRIAANIESMTDEEAMGYALADNKTAEESAWNHEVLQAQAILLADSQGTVPGFSLDELLILRQNDFSPVPTGEGAQTWQELWTGMPEFVQEDQTGFKSIVVHFATEEDFNAFLKLVKQTPGDVRQKSIWYPKAEIGKFSDKRYVQAGGEGK